MYSHDQQNKQEDVSWITPLRLFAIIVVIALSQLVTLFKNYYLAHILPYRRALNTLALINSKIVNFEKITYLWFSATETPVHSTDIEKLLNYGLSEKNIYFLSIIGIGIDGFIPIKHILTIREQGQLLGLKTKLQNYKSHKPILPFTFFELNTLEHIKNCKEFWDVIVSWPQDKMPPVQNKGLLDFIKKSNTLLDDIIKLSTSVQNRLNKDLESATAHSFKKAHFAINDLRPLMNAAPASTHPLIQKLMPTYCSASAVSYERRQLNMYQFAFEEGYTRHQPKPQSATLYIPFRVDVEALLPFRHTRSRVVQLQSMFDQNFNERIKHRHLKQEDILPLKTRGLTNFLWPNWGVPKQSFGSDPFIGNPGRQICSTLLAQDLWKSLQVVDCQLQMWGYKDHLRNPFGDHQRLDSMLPSDIIKQGIEHGWIVRLRHSESEKLIRFPETPAHCRTRTLKN